MRETQIALANLVQRNPSSMDRHVCRCRLRLSRLATDPKSPGRGIFGYRTICLFVSGMASWLCDRVRLAAAMLPYLPSATIQVT